MNHRTLGAALAALSFASTCLAQGTLYTCRSGRELFSINPATGGLTALGSISAGVNTSASLAYDCATQITYVSQSFANVGVQRNLWRINLPSGVATLVGPYGDTALIIHGIEIDSRNGNLYGISSHNGGLYSIDKSTGLATLIGLTGIVGGFPFPQLLFDSDNCVMYTTSSETDSLYTVDLTTGAATLVGPFNFAGTFSAMTYAHDTNTAYMIENSTATPRLFTVDLATGNATLVATLTGGQNLIGLVYVPANCPGPCASNTPFTSFCSGDAVGTTCLGCGNNGGPDRGCANFSFAAGAMLTSSGLASVTPVNDTLTLTCSSMSGPGLFFQADGIGATTTFGDGMLCASVGIIRLGIVFPTGGTASYPGGLTPNPIHSAGGPISAGQTKHYQCWYRDAGETSPGVSFCTPATFNLSNGISLVWGS